MDLQKLKAPFPPTDVEWRIQSAGKKDEGVWAKVIAYITNRAIADRLDEVCGPEGWQNEFKEWQLGTPGVLCGIGVHVNGHWIWKWDGAEQPKEKADGQPVAVKGGFSAAMKRAGAQWGIGRYLYDLSEGWATIVEKGTPGARYAKMKDGTPFYWVPPALPRWALPEATEGERQAPQATSAPRGDGHSPSASPSPAAAPATKLRSAEQQKLLDQGLMPIGNHKGTPMAEMDVRDLDTARAWLWSNGGSARWAPLIDAISAQIHESSRQAAGGAQ